MVRYHTLREFPGTPRIVGSLWEAYGSLMGKGYHFWGHLEIPLNTPKKTLTFWTQRHGSVDGSFDDFPFQKG